MMVARFAFFAEETEPVWNVFTFVFEATVIDMM